MSSVEGKQWFSVVVRSSFSFIGEIDGELRFKKMDTKLKLLLINCPLLRHVRSSAMQAYNVARILELKGRLSPAAGCCYCVSRKNGNDKHIQEVCENL